MRQDPATHGPVCWLASLTLILAIVMAIRHGHLRWFMVSLQGVSLGSVVHAARVFAATGGAPVAT